MTPLQHRALKILASSIHPVVICMHDVGGSVRGVIARNGWATTVDPSRISWVLTDAGRKRLAAMESLLAKGFVQKIGSEYEVTATGEQAVQGSL